MRGRHEQPRHEVLVARLHAAQSLAAAPLRPVLGDRVALHVAEVRHGHDHVLLGDQVLGVDHVDRARDLGAARVAVLLADLGQLLEHDLEHAGVAGQQALQVLDARPHLGQLVEHALALERGERAQAHLEDRVGLALAEREALHQRAARGGRVVGGADQRDHLVEVVEHEGQALEDVRARLGLAQVVDGAPDHHLAAEVEEVAQHLLQRERLRAAVDERQHVDAEGGLQRRLLVELVERHVGRGVALELDHHADALAVALVAQVGDPVDASLAHVLGDLLEQRRLVHHERDLGDHDARAALAFLDLGAPAHRDQAAPGGVGLADAVGAADQRAGREVGSGQLLEQLVERAVGVARLELERIHHLAQVVRRHVGGHADRDPGRAVDEQVGQPGGQHHRLAGRAVEVGHEVDRLAVDVAQQLLGDAREAALGVAVGGRRVAVDRAEVALPVDQRVAEREVLDHAHERVVDRAVAVRVVVLEHLADHARALGVGARGDQALLLHRVQDAAVDGLEAVAHVGQRAADDDRHRVVEERRADLVLDGDRDRLVALAGRTAAGAAGRGRGRGRLVGRRRLVGHGCPSRCPGSARSGRSSR